MNILDRTDHINERICIENFKIDESFKSLLKKCENFFVIIDFFTNVLKFIICIKNYFH